MSLQSVVMLSALFLLVTPHARPTTTGHSAHPRRAAEPSIRRWKLFRGGPQRNQALARLLAEVAERPPAASARGRAVACGCPEDVLQPEDAKLALRMAADGASFMICARN